MLRLLEGKGDAAEFVARASVGFSESFLKQHERLDLHGPWIQEVLRENYRISRFEEEKDVQSRRKMAEAGITQLITVPLRGNEGPIGILNIGALPGKRFHEDELAYLVNVANFLGTTVENVNLFEQVKPSSSSGPIPSIPLATPLLSTTGPAASCAGMRAWRICWAGKVRR